MTTEEIKRSAEKFFDDYEYVGVRTQEPPFELGTINHCSSVWINGEESSEELDGICVTNAHSKAVKYHSDDAFFNFKYFGTHIAIICGNIGEYGEDDGEIIIKDPIVVKILA